MGGAKRQRTRPEGSAWEARAEERPVLGKAVPVSVAVLEAETGKACTSSDNSKASRTTSAKVPTADGPAPARVVSVVEIPDPCLDARAPVSEASKAESDASGANGSERAARGSDPGLGSGTDSEGEGRSARSSRDIVRSAGVPGGGGGGEGEGDSSGGGGGSGSNGVREGVRDGDGVRGSCATGECLGALTPCDRAHG